ncbi:hypothetical protein [Actinomadura rubrobrunea]|uniref:hypothetical protein n=1 Tax=Actinomadura rubrobrunea TaxID=115335 RepID=UPI00082C0818|nr:hypothetical protein [Actinomadura rubrobrunea]
MPSSRGITVATGRRAGTLQPPRAARSVPLLMLRPDCSVLTMDDVRARAERYPSDLFSSGC